MDTLDTATAKLSIGQKTDDDQQRRASVDTSQSNGDTTVKKWTPRWKTDASVKPTAYDDGKQGAREATSRYGMNLKLRQQC